MGGRRGISEAARVPDAAPAPARRHHRRQGARGPQVARRRQRRGRPRRVDRESSRRRRHARKRDGLPALAHDVRRTTVADVVVDGLNRAGTPRVFGVPSGGANLALIEAARAAGLPTTLASGETAACIMAAVTGDLVDAPGAVVIGPGPGVAAAVAGVVHGLLDRAPVIVLTSDHPAAVLACKETLGVEPESAAHRIAHAARLAMAEPRGPVHLDVAADVVTRPAVPVATSCRPAPLPYPDAAA